MQHLKLYQKGKIVFLFFAVTAILTAACGRLAYLMIVQSDYYGKRPRHYTKENAASKPPAEKLWTATESFWQIIARYVPFP